jgi:hypothetical protein
MIFVKLSQRYNYIRYVAIVVKNLMIDYISNTSYFYVRLYTFIKYIEKQQKYIYYLVMKMIEEGKKAIFTYTHFQKESFDYSLHRLQHADWIARGNCRRRTSS